MKIDKNKQQLDQCKIPSDGVSITLVIWRTNQSQLGFPTGRDSATFWDNGIEVSSLSRDKGTTGQAKNLNKGRDGPGLPKFRKGQPKSGTGHGTKWNRAEKDILKQENDVLK